MAKDQAYEQREHLEFERQLKEPYALSAKERREAEAAFLKTLSNNPDIVAERIEWLILGNYGYGAYRQAWQTIYRPKMNRAAWLVQTIGALEWQVTRSNIAKLWHKLTEEQKLRLDEVVKKVIKDAEEDPERPRF